MSTVLRVILLLSLSISTIIAHAQYDDDDEIDLMRMKNRFSIKLTPSSLADPIAVQLPVGIEYFFAHFGIYLQYGIPLKNNYPNTDFNNTEHLDITSDHKIKLELRKYLYSTNHSRFYLGVEFYERTMKIDRTNSFYVEKYNGEQANVHFTAAKLERKEYAFGADFGAMHKIYRQFFLEWYIGLGLHLTNGIYSDVENPTTGAKGRSYINLVPNTYNVLHNGSALSFYPPFAVRFSYLLGK
jgi:hypothetical protein